MQNRYLTAKLFHFTYLIHRTERKVPSGMALFLAMMLCTHCRLMKNIRLSWNNKACTIYKLCHVQNMAYIDDEVLRMLRRYRALIRCSEGYSIELWGFYIDCGRNGVHKVNFVWPTVRTKLLIVWLFSICTYTYLITWCISCLFGLDEIKPILNRSSITGNFIMTCNPMAFHYFTT